MRFSVTKKRAVRLAPAVVLLLLCMCAPAAASKNEKRANEILKQMTWKEKLAQMFMVGLPENAADIQKKYQFGGYVLFEADFRSRTPKKAQEMISGLQKKSKVKALIAVDEEGGTVNRVSKIAAYRSKAFESPQAVYKNGGYLAVTKDTRQKAKFLKNLGINTNLAPVADTPYRTTDFIYRRSFSTNVGAVSKYIKTVVKEMKKNNVVSTLKHFPGYGGNGDTHTDIIRDRRSRGTFESRDLKPFQAGIQAGCDMIMVSHNIVDCFDSSMPASLSKKVHQYLRKKLNFKGVIISDDLSMAGASRYTGGTDKAAVKAIQAGNDMIITTDYSKQFQAVYKAFKQGQISKSQVNASVKRILVMKLKRGIIR